MLLVADSGSTKCDWLLDQENGNSLAFTTVGFNPLFHSTEFIVAEIWKNEGLMEHTTKVTEVHFFGASISSDERKTVVVNALKQVFRGAEIHADHDLAGAAIATCNGDPGIACILGTGSNSCFYDGKEIYEKVPALGYILGDEAGGAWFGKEFLRLYLYHQLPALIEQELEHNGVFKEIIFNRVYQQEGANVYLASFMTTIKKYKDEKIVQQLLFEGFREFLKAHVICYNNYKLFPVHFVGSVAKYFRMELEQVCSELGIQSGVFTNEPVQGLLEYYRNKK
ncbi:MAG: N-acetylglucosamine kinase [Bacteroidetes bacterium]|nr:N-acetylglucosamine kinase [Bacteroidota bacterium]